MVIKMKQIKERKKRVTAFVNLAGKTTKKEIVEYIN